MITETERPRNIAYAEIWTAQREPIAVGMLSDELYGRGILPSFTDPEAATAPLTDAGLAEATFRVGDVGFRILSQSSSKGSGCLVTLHESSVEDLPDDYLARRAVARPRLRYLVEAGGPSHSDRNLCEHIAEILMILTDGVALLGGLGTKGNRATLHKTTWIGKIKAL